MKITLLTVGKIKEKYFTDAIKEYTKRLSRYCEIRVEEVSDEAVPEKASDAVCDMIRLKEGERLIRIIDHYPAAHVIALAIDGKSYDSVGFSRHLSDLQVRGKSHLVFVIGGSIGLSDQVLARSGEKISFSKMTFPHQLMRVIALEQIYRAMRIARNEPYHK